MTEQCFLLRGSPRSSRGICIFCSNTPNEIPVTTLTYALLYVIRWRNKDLLVLLAFRYTHPLKKTHTKHKTNNTASGILTPFQVRSTTLQSLWSLTRRFHVLHTLGGKNTKIQQVFSSRDKSHNKSLTNRIVRQYMAVFLTFRLWRSPVHSNTTTRRLECFRESSPGYRLWIHPFSKQNSSDTDLIFRRTLIVATRTVPGKRRPSNLGPTHTK